MLKIQLSNEPYSTWFEFSQNFNIGFGHNFNMDSQHRMKFFLEKSYILEQQVRIIWLLKNKNTHKKKE